MKSQEDNRKMNGITIIIADDHPIVRQGLKSLLEKEPDFHIVGEASDGLETVEVVKRLKPKILILDLMMPGINGMEVTLQVKRYLPQTHVIILSMYSNEAYVLESLRNGAEGYVLKDSQGKELIRAIHEVIAGQRYLSLPLSERAIDTYIKAIKSSKLDPYETLTIREREVLYMVSEGLSSTEVAKRLSISPRTVEVHRSNLMQKLGLKKQADLIRYAIQRGILLLKD